MGALPLTHSALTNRSILVTGGTGSFGQAFVRHALTMGARRVVVFSRDELKQHDMAKALCDDRLRFVLGSVADAEPLNRAMRGVELVVHAAAMKQVPACELNPWEAFQTNTIGTRNVAHAAIAAGVQRAILLSTDKAAAPNTHYGATKLCAERLWNGANVYAAGTPTRLACTRYGNVLGSRGSVVPIFREQVKNRQRLTITDAKMSRFWMRLADGVWLVEAALAKARGGEVFIPKAGSADIITVAQAVQDETHDSDVPVRWTETGIRRGEKLHETLISEDEARDAYEFPGYYVIEPERSWEFLPPLDAPKVPAGFSYRSDNNPHQLTVEELKELIG